MRIYSTSAICNRDFSISELISTLSGENRLTPFEKRFIFYKLILGELLTVVFTRSNKHKWQCWLYRSKNESYKNGINITSAWNDRNNLKKGIFDYMPLSI